MRAALVLATLIGRVVRAVRRAHDFWPDLIAVAIGWSLVTALFALLPGWRQHTVLFAATPQWRAALSGAALLAAVVCAVLKPRHAGSLLILGWVVACWGEGTRAVAPSTLVNVAVLIGYCIRASRRANRVATRVRDIVARREGQA